MLPAGFRSAVQDLITEDPTELAEYGRDWTRIYPPAPSAVAFPRSTEDVARVLRLASEHRVAVVPSGGRTGLAGGAVAPDGELVLSLSRMNRIDPVDELGGTVRVQAGAVTQAVHEHCAQLGLTWPVDFASKGSSQIGGNIATNAGGVRVIRYGMTRQWVLGLQIVLASGVVLDLNGALEKNNTGLDLRQLFIGSEGTLGVITEATLKLARIRERADVFLFAVPDLAAVLRLFRESRKQSFTLAAFEFFTDRCAARVLRHRKLRLPFAAASSHYVLLEAENADPDVLAAFGVDVVEREMAQDATLAQTPTQSAELWALREGISESLAATGFPHKNDIALPIAALETFCAELEKLIADRYPGFELCLFGHIGDGNLHVNVMRPEGMDPAAFAERTKAADHDVFALVKRHHGSISAEHGVGLLKKRYLSYSRSPAELELMGQIKRTLDPLGILNPGKIL